MSDDTPVSGPPRTSVLLVDDNETFLNIAASFLERQEDLTIVGACLGGREALLRAPELRPQVIVIDLSMPEIGGLEAIPLLREALPGTRIIALTMLDDNAHRWAALQAGADGFVSKSGMITDLIPTIRRAVGSEIPRHRALVLQDG